MMKGKSNSFKALAGFAGVGIYATTVYVSYHIYKLSNLPSPNPNCHLPENQSISEKIYTDLANTYDDSVTWDERLMLLKSKRKQLTNLAKGHVLETSAGTGRNLDFFKPEIIASLTISDSSQQMLQNALIKFRPLREAFDKLDISVDFKLMDSENLLYKDSTFDTVLDTFGLCSHQDPVKALTEMKRTCKENGKILLLEHGRSRYEC
ncbi:hypothetical protein HDV02_000150 [Globomyces sp. JEL0801]|nr:hypothetical protein HDV02_000150 [Globomyces sp. JEL0801]